MRRTPPGWVGLLGLCLAGCPTVTPITNPGTGGSSGGASSSTGGASGTGGSTGSGSTSSGGTTSGGTTTSGGSSSGGNADAGLPFGLPCTIVPPSQSPGSPNDPCEAYGLACGGTVTGFDGGVIVSTGSCQLPATHGHCAPSLGCAASSPPADCVDTGQAGDYCLVACSSVLDCPSLDDHCVQVLDGGSFCMTDFCGPGTGNGGAYYGPCTVTSGDDGQCLPRVSDTGSIVGLCTATGDVADGGACTTDRTSATTALCKAGEACLGLGKSGRRCLPVCALADAGLTGTGCASLCVPDSPYTLFGVCPPPEVPCTLDAATGPAGQSGDPCESWGFACAGLQRSDAELETGTCQPPTEFDGCNPEVGCAAPFQCTQVPSEGTMPLCLQRCALPGDCEDPIDTCLPLPSGASVCAPNPCGPGSVNANGTSFYGPCASTKADDGFCLPYGVKTFGGICLGSGSATVGEDCASDRSGGKPLCAPGLICFPNPNSIAGPNACLPVCQANPATGGGSSKTACDGGYCVDFDLASQAAWGLCFTPCKTSASCPSNESCVPVAVIDGGAATGCVP